MAKRSENQSLFNLETPAKPQGPVECLGMTFENDEARREHFLRLLREMLSELHAKLGGVPFTTVEDAVERMKSVEKWPMGDDARLRALAERMRHADSSKDLLQRWKDVVGFPHGEIEDILNLSDPPYYTACPNPFIVDFIKHYGKPYDPNVPYSKEPFAVDVSVGKTDPIYKAHSYHTKVPHLAIVPSILHYTEPGDVVLDGFCGSGMTGVAVQWCGSAPESYKRDLEALWEKEGRKKPKWGPRRVVLGDLAPAATFIAANYNLPFEVDEFARAARQILDEVEQEIGWMYETLHTDGRVTGIINFTVWSEVFACPECAHEIVFTRDVLDPTTKQVLKTFACPTCQALLTKKQLKRLYISQFDPFLQTTIKQPKRIPVLIDYSIGRSRYQKIPDDNDIEILARIEKQVRGNPPTTEFPFSQMWDAPRLREHGVTHIHHLFTRRALHALSCLFERISSQQSTSLRLALRALVHHQLVNGSLRNSYRPTSSFGNRGVTGAYYISSMPAEANIIKLASGTARRIVRAFRGYDKNRHRCALITTQSAASLDALPDNSIDYIFVDPPFGDNFPYWELNFLFESWHRVWTVGELDAIVDRSKKDKAKQKGLRDYQGLMSACFAQYYRVLKPGRWMTLVFSNSKNAVWHAIQEAMATVGFVVADVRILDKKQGSFKQITSIAPKQDLVISAYKPNGGLEERFKLTAGTEEGVWDFVRTHLKQLPVFVTKDGKAEVIAERQNYLLFDRMVAFHVQRGVTVPLSAAEFYAGLAQRFPERDGMYFLPEQVAEYDKKRMKVKEVLQLQLFVTDEASAIQWLKQQLTRKPQTFQELHPQFLKEIGGWQKHEKPLELSELLEQNFLRYDGKGPIPKQIVSWMRQSAELRKIIDEQLASGQAQEDDSGVVTRDPRLIDRAKARWYVPDPNKAGDLEKLRERALLREFEEYRESKQKRLKVFRLEAVRAGFKKAWQERDYATIIAVARKIPENVLQEDPKLLMWYDQALTRSGEDA